MASSRNPGSDGEHAAEVAAQGRGADHGDGQQPGAEDDGRPRPRRRRRAGARRPSGGRRGGGEQQRADREQPEAEVAVAGEPAGDDRVVPEQSVELQRRAGEHVADQRRQRDRQDDQRRAQRGARRQGPSRAAAVTTPAAPSTASDQRRQRRAGPLPRHQAGQVGRHRQGGDGQAEHPERRRRTPTRPRRAPSPRPRARACRGRPSAAPTEHQQPEEGADAAVVHRRGHVHVLEVGRPPRPAPGGRRWRAAAGRSSTPARPGPARRRAVGARSMSWT